MKKYPVVYLRKAQQDLLAISEYIRKDNPENAKIWIEKIDKSLGRLAAFPESGAIAKDEHLAALGYRIVIVGEYLAFYKVRSRRVEIHRILHGRQKYSFLL